MKKIDLSETFTFPDIPWQKYPVYSLSQSGRIYNFKSVVYPSPVSRKRFTRRKQLLTRSTQAKIFDALINIGYFDPLIVVREFPILIRNNHRVEDQDGGFYLADYYFPTVLRGRGLIVELDSELHDTEKDKKRDEYLINAFGLDTFRIRDLHKESTQKGRFKELLKLLRSEEAGSEPKILPFMTEILDYNKENS